MGFFNNSFLSIEIPRTEHNSKKVFSKKKFWDKKNTGYFSDGTVDCLTLREAAREKSGEQTDPKERKTERGSEVTEEVTGLAKSMEKEKGKCERSKQHRAPVTRGRGVETHSPTHKV